MIGPLFCSDIEKHVPKHRSWRLNAADWWATWGQMLCRCFAEDCPRTSTFDSAPPRKLPKNEVQNKAQLEKIPARQLLGACNSISLVCVVGAPEIWRRWKYRRLGDILIGIRMLPALTLVAPSSFSGGCSLEKHAHLKHHSTMYAFTCFHAHTIRAIAPRRSMEQLLLLS